MKYIATIIFFGLLLLQSSCSLQIKWSPEIDKLADLARSDTNKWGSLASDVTTFYELLHQKNWEATYNFRTLAFKREVKKNTYLEAMNKDGQDWSLVNYKIQAVNIFGIESENKVQLVLEITENPGPRHSFAVVWWKREESGWRCEEAGPTRLSLAHRVTAPEKE